MGQSGHYYSPSFLILTLYRFNYRNCFDSYDTRGAHAGTPSHWRDEEVLEDRAVFRTHKEPAELIINPVKVTHSLSSLRFPPQHRASRVSTAQRSIIGISFQEKDAGNFRCRVDFKLSQTRNSNVNLEVVGAYPQKRNMSGNQSISRASNSHL